MACLNGPSPAQSASLRARNPLSTLVPAGYIKDCDALFLIVNGPDPKGSPPMRHRQGRPQSAGYPPHNKDLVEAIGALKLITREHPPSIAKQKENNKGNLNIPLLIDRFSIVVDP